MAKEVFHVVPSGDGWAVKKEGNERASSTHDTQKNAIDAAREFAKEGDEIVVHRADGSIRDHTTYTGSSNGGNADRPDRPEAHDIWSVGTRVRWAPILAGVMTALAVTILLTSLATAVGLTAADRVNMRASTASIIAGVTLMVIMVTSLFAGGYVATQTTTRETKFEAVIYGTLVWATTFALGALLTAAGLMGSARLALDATRTPQNVTAERPFWRDLGWSDEQQRRYQEMTNPDAEYVAKELKLTPDQRRQLEEARQVNPRAAAWWVFFGMALSIAASIGGAIAGAGPEVTRRLLRREAVGDGSPRDAQRMPAREGAAV